MPLTNVSNGFRHPLGEGTLTEANDGDGFYVAQNFDEFNSSIGVAGSYHLGEDWNGEGGGNTDLGFPVYAVSNGEVIQTGFLAGLGNYIAIKHVLPVPTVINGVTRTEIVSLYAHLQNAPSLVVGQIVTIGQQIGNVGATGATGGVAHLHFEIRLATGLGDLDGYNPAGAPSNWVDPTNFINDHRTFSAQPPLVTGPPTVDLLAGQVVEARTLYTQITGTSSHVTHVKFWDASDPQNAGDFLRDGVIVGGSTDLIPIAELGLYSYRAGIVAGTFNDIVVEAFDSNGLDSNDLAVRINVVSQTGGGGDPPPTPGVNQRPTISGDATLSFAPGERVPVANLYRSFADADGIVVEVRFSDQTLGGGHFERDGLTLSSSQIFVPVAELGRYSFVTASTAGVSDTLVIDVIDDDRLDSQDLVTQIRAVAPVNPTISAGESPTVQLNQKVSVGTWFNASDVDGVVSKIRFYDVTADSGYFELDGARQVGVFDVALTQLSRVQYFGGPVAGSGDFQVSAIDNHGLKSAELSLRVKIGAAVTPTPVSTDVVSKNKETAPQLAAGEIRSGIVDAIDMNGGTDADYYKVTLTGGNRYTFSGTSETSTADSLDTIFLRLRDETFKPVDPPSVGSVQAAEGVAPSFVFDVPGVGPKTYYFGISAGGNEFKTDTGEYSIWLEDGGPKPAGFTLLPGMDWSTLVTTSEVVPNMNSTLTALDSTHNKLNQDIATTETAFEFLGAPTFSDVKVSGVSSDGKEVYDIQNPISFAAADQPYRFLIPNVEALKVKGLQLAVDSLIEVFKTIQKTYPDLIDELYQNGMYVPKLQLTSSDTVTEYISNHTWGIAIDFGLHGVDVTNFSEQTNAGIAALIPIFNEFKWYAGAGFSNHDSIHFELSVEFLRDHYSVAMSTRGDQPLNLVGTEDRRLLAIQNDTSSAATITIGSEGETIIVGDATTNDVIGYATEFHKLAYDGNEAVDDVTGGPLTFTQIDQATFYFNGFGGDDLLKAVAMDRRIVADGGVGNDLLQTGLGDDLIIGGPGDDSNDGGSGNDTITYESTLLGIQVNLAAVQDHAIGVEIDTDQIFNIENVTGGSGNDVINGDNFDNVIDGNGGDDVLDGGGGFDRGRLDVRHSTVSSSISFDPTPGVIHAVAGGASFVNFEDMELLLGSGNDSISFGAGAEGALAVYGGAGADRLIVDLSHVADVVASTIDNVVTAYSGFGTEDLSAVNGLRTSTPFYFLQPLLDYQITYGEFETVELHTGSGGSYIVDRAGNDIIYGGDGQDIFVAPVIGRLPTGEGALANAAGDDAFFGGAGEDEFQFYFDPLAQGGSTTIDGGANTDLGRLNFSDFVGNFVGKLDTAPGVVNILPGELRIANVEEFEIQLGAGDDYIEVGAGSLVDGGAGFDTLVLDLSATVHRLAMSLSLPQQFIDQLKWVVDLDDWVVDLDGSPNPIGVANFGNIERLEINSGSGHDFLDARNYFFGSYSIFGDYSTVVEASLFGNGGNDYLYGTLGNDSLDGGADNDVIVGGLGFDQMLGGAGDDSIAGALEGEVLDGGADSDTVTYLNATGAVIVDLAAQTGAMLGGTGLNDTLLNFENVTGSAFDDTLLGDAGANTLDGGYGVDTLDGREGGDTYILGLDALDLRHDLLFDTGTEGHDRLVLAPLDASAPITMMVTLGDFGPGNDMGLEEISGVGAFRVAIVAPVLFDEATLEQLPVTWDFSHTLLTNITLIGSGLAEQITGSAGDDDIFGNGGGDMIFAGAGDDVLTGSNADDYLAGGAGFDRASYRASPYFSGFGPVFVDLRIQGVAQDTGGDGFDTLVGIEALEGSMWNDTLIGDDGDNLLDGGGGSDTLIGNGGTDTVSHSSEFLTFVPPGTEDLPFPVNGMLIDLEAGISRFIDFPGEQDTLSGIENAIGSVANDTIFGDAGANVLIGGRGDDFLEGRGGGDFLDGGTGFDSMAVDLSQSVSSVDFIFNLTPGVVQVALDGTSFVNMEGMDLRLGASDDKVTFIASGAKAALTATGGAGDDRILIDWSSLTDYVSSTLGGIEKSAWQTLDPAVDGLRTTASHFTFPQVPLALDISVAFDGFETVEFHAGSGGSEYIDRAGNDIVYGGAGHDSFNDPVVVISYQGVNAELAIHDAGGHDIFYGGAGGDAAYLYYDPLKQGTSSMFFDGGDGHDWTEINYLDHEGAIHWRFDPTPGVINTLPGLTLVNVEDFEITLGAGDDHIEIVGITGEIRGGAGFDTLSFDLSAETVDLFMPSSFGAIGTVAPGSFGSGHWAYFSSGDIEHIEITSGSGNDVLDASGYGFGGGFAEAVLYGSSGNDELTGTSGADLLHGGLGSDVLRGGFMDGSVDMFVYDDGDDAVWDFEDGIDRIDISALAATKDLEDILAVATQTGSADTPWEHFTRIDFGVGQSLTIHGVDLVALSEDDFIFANVAPTDLAVTPDSVAENTTAGTVVGALSAVDADANETFAYTLLDDAGGRFALDGANLVVTGALDREAAASHQVAVRVTDSAGNIFDKTLTITIANVNETPVLANAITDQSSAEDTAWHFVVAADAFADADSAILDYKATLSDGTELPAWLSFDAATRSFAGTPPENFNGTFDLKVVASDGEFSASDVFQLAITPVADLPVITSDGGGEAAAIVVGENVPFVTTVIATHPDSDQTLSYRIAGGMDAAQFLIDEASGALSFASIPDFEAPLDAGQDNVYDVIVEVFDANGAIDTQTLEVSVTDANGVTIAGSAGADIINAVQTVPGEPLPTPEGDTIDGGAGADLISGLGGDDTLNGGAGGDGLTGGRGNDLIDGGSGKDTAYYSDLGVAANAGGIVVSLSDGSGTVSWNGEIDTLLNIDGIVGTAGADQLNFGAGDQYFFDLFGRDTISGGSGYDFVSYRLLAGGGPGVLGMTVSLSDRTATDGYGNTDTLSSIEGVEGGAGNDTISGDGLDNLIAGWAGNDVLSGGSQIRNSDQGSRFIDGVGDAIGDTLAFGLRGAIDGNVAVVADLAAGSATDSFGGTDTFSGFENLHGSKNSDRLLGDGGDNIIAGFAGSDFIDGRSGQDMVSYDSEVTVGVVVDLEAGTASDGQGGVDTLVSIERVLGSMLADTILGSAANNLFMGGAGNDILDGRDGIDTISFYHNPNADLPYDNEDFAVFDVHVDLSQGLATHSSGEIDSFSSIENVIGGLGNDTILGNEFANELSGSRGNDLLDGGGGNDFLTDFGGGNDTINGGADDDRIIIFDVGIRRIDGGSGNDFASLSMGHLTGDNNLDFSSAGAAVQTLSDGTTIVNVERIEMRLGSGDDSVRFDASRPGLNVVNSVAGFDTLIVDWSALNENISLANGNPPSVRTANSSHILEFRNIERLEVDGGAGSDYFSADGTGALEVVFSGNGGADYLYGLSGADYLSGGGGDDFLHGAGGADMFVYSSGADILSDFQPGLDRIDLSLIGGAYSFAAIMARTVDTAGVDGHTRIDFGGGNVLTLTGVVKAALSEGDFVAAVNTAPTDVLISANTVAENAQAGIVVGDLASVDGNEGEPSTFTLLDDAGGLFSLDGSRVVVSGALNFEAAASHLIRVRATDTVGQFFDKEFSVQISDVNEAPSIASNGAGDTASIAVAENGVTVATVAAADPDSGQTLSYRLAGGADAALFAINAATGALSFLRSPDFEVPADSDRNNSYSVIVEVSDGQTGIDTQTVTVNVTNVVGATINGGNGNDTINGTQTVPGQPFATNEEDTINANAGADVINGLGGNDTLLGGAGADTLRGGAGNDMLDGGAGNDNMIGGTGNDTFVVSATGDTVSENANEGIDTVVSAVSWTLGGNLENLTLTGAADLDGTGNGLANTLFGNSGRNTLSGAAGNDVLDGGAGADTLNGGAGGDTLLGGNGADLLTGGNGADLLTGGAGADRFIFSALSDSAPGAADEISDFLHAADLLDLAAIDARTGVNGNQAFIYGGQNANVIANGLTWYELDGNTFVQADVNGDTTADLQLTLRGTNHQLAATDFLL